jgi:uncharacterized protein YdaU (DUF1376 family)
MMHYYKFNIADWHLATSHLSFEEEIVYFKLCNFYYDTEKPISIETQMVSRRLRLTKYKELVDQILQEFFVLEDDGWHHNRCDSEILAYHEKAERNRAVGKLGGRPKKTQMVSKRIPNETLTTNHKPLTTNHNTNTPDGVGIDLWNDFLVYRKRLKAPVSDRVVARLVKEAGLAKMTLSDVIETIMFKGWRSFEASWIQQQAIQAQKAKEMPLGSDKQIEEAYRIECGGDPQQSRFSSYFDMKKFIIDSREKRARV